MMYAELTLNRGWIYGIDDEWAIGERTFTIPAEYYYNLMDFFGISESAAKALLDTYIPEEDGALIYEFALRDDAIVEEQEHYYCHINETTRIDLI